MELNKFFNKQNTFAVVGVSRDKRKYGYRVFRDLIDNKYKVYPINLNLKNIENHKVYYSLKDSPVKPDIVVTVVPPEVTLDILNQIKKLGISKVWMQPGSESREATLFCEKNNIQFINNACIMVDRIK